MTNRENYLSIARKTGYDYMPVNFSMCPSLAERYNAYVKEHDVRVPVGEASVRGQPVKSAPREMFLERYYRDKTFKPGTHIDVWGVAHEPGSAAAYHMTYMYHPMEDFDSVEQILDYPFPVFCEALEDQKKHVEEIHSADLAAIGHMEVTIWETAWYMRGMENLMCDMISEDPMAEALLDRVTEISVTRAVSFAKAGADALFLGDDVGMQRTIMMSEGFTANG